MLLLGLVSYSFVVLHQNEEKPAGVPEIQIGVTAQQFVWSYEYPPSVTGGAPLKSYQLYVPEGDTVYFNMRSRDVIHAFWIPAFRLQEDVVPGITTHYRATPDRLGHLPGRLQPAVRRRALADALGHPRGPAAQFRAWLRSQERSAPPSPRRRRRAGQRDAIASTARPGQTVLGIHHPAGEDRRERDHRGDEAG